MIGTALLVHHEGFEGRPCRALSYLLWLTQGLVALAGLRTLGFVGVAPIGSYPSCWSKAAVRLSSASIRLAQGCSALSECVYPMEQGCSALGQCVCPFGEAHALQHPDT